MKTNIRLLLALAAMLAVPALSAQPRGNHHSSRGGRPEHHSSVSSRPSSGLKHGPSGPSSHTDARPVKPDAHRPDMHRPAPSVRPDAHRPAPPVHHNPVPPVHHRHHVTVLPPHAVRRYFNGLLYYFWDNCYYRYRDNAYYVCDPPIGAIVYELPDTYDIITLNGRRYYKVYNTLYDLVVDSSGRPAFEVVGYLNG